MKSVLILLHLLFQAFAYHIASLFAPADMLSIINSLLQETESKVTHESFQTYSKILQKSEEIDFLIVFPAESLILSQVQIFSETHQVPSLIFSEGPTSKYSVFSEQSSNCISDQILSLMNTLNLIPAGVVWTFSEKNLKIIENLKENLNEKIKTTAFSVNVSVSDITMTLSKVFKKDGVRFFVVLADELTCSRVSKGLEKSFLNTEGNAGVFLDECYFSVRTEGSVLLVSKNKENFEDEISYKKSLIQKIFKFLEKPGLSKDQIIKKIQEFSGTCESSIINIRNFTTQPSGSLKNSSISIKEKLIFYDEVEDLSNFTISKIKFSANTGTFNPLGVPPTSANQKFHQGTYFAVGKINRDKTLLPNHELVLYDKVNCGVNFFDYNYSKECFLKHRGSMGVAYIPTFMPITMSVHNQLLSMNKIIPMIAGGGSASLLSNKTSYPYYIRLVSPSSSYASAWANLIQIYGWDKIILHNSFDAFGISIMNVLNSSQETYKYRIINDQKYWNVNNSYDNSSIPLYYEHIKHSVSLGCNIVFLAMSDPTPFFWIEGFYDMGVRRGDLTFIVFTLSGLDSFTSSTANVMKRKELMHGSFVVLNAAWLGEYGNAVKQEFLKYYDNTWSRSSFVDSSFTVANTISFLLDQGQPFEEVDVFMKAARNIRFLGTTGTISFDSESNNRNLVYFNLFNFYEDSQGVWHDDPVALISPLGSVYYEYLQSITWTAGTLPMSMKEKYENCPFYEREIQDSNLGIKVKIAVSCTLIFITSVLTVYVLKHVKNKKPGEIKVKTFIEFQDYLSLGFIFIESLQVISIGPSFAAFNKFLSNLSEMLSLNLSKVTQFKDRTFWVIFSVMMGLSYCWIIVLLLTSCRFFKLPYKMLGKLRALKRLSIPLMSNYFFLPVVVSIISILMCDKATGDEITDAYLNYDCNLTCWKGNHVVYAIFACFLIVFYVPIAILYRTLWQEEDLSHNIKTNSRYLIVKNISVVILVIIGKILKNDFKLTHAIIFIVIEFCVFVFVLIIRKPFNFDRASLWAKAMIVCVLWNSLICLLAICLEIENYALVILQIIGWVFVFFCGFIIQHKMPPSLLVSKTGRSIVDLFRFAFGIKQYVESKYLELDQEANDCEAGSRIDS